MATQFGATDVIDASGGDVVENVRKLNGGYFFEVIGLEPPSEQCYGMLRDGDNHRDGPKADQDRYLRGVLPPRERKIQGSSMGSNRFRPGMPRGRVLPGRSGRSWSN